jgi:hypothetical protein
VARIADLLVTNSRDLAALTDQLDLKDAIHVGRSSRSS